MTESKHLHFIGIGGSSMSGLAHLMREQGCTVSGSDSTASHKTEHLMDEGIEVFIGHAPENVRGAMRIVPVEHVDAVLREALVEKPGAQKA